jgi:hypothetical protein
MTANDLRQILADALDGAAECLRGGISGQPVAAPAQPKSESSDPLAGITKPTLTVDEAAGLLGVSVYASIRAGEFPALRAAVVSSCSRMHCGVGWQSPMGRVEHFRNSEPLDQ